MGRYGEIHASLVERVERRRLEAPQLGAEAEQPRRPPGEEVPQPAHRRLVERLESYHVGVCADVYV